MTKLECNGHLQHTQQQQQQQQGMKQSNSLLANTSLDGSTLVSLVPATNKSTSLVTSTSSNTSNSLTSMMQQVVPNTNVCVSMVNLLSPSKPSNISELSNSSMLSSSSGSSTLDSSSGMNGNSLSGTPTSKRSRSSKNCTDHQKDGKYFERRKRNNVAAKKSRDARKQREDEIAIRASFLEKENSILKAQLQTLKDEAQQLRILLAQKKSSSLAAAAAAASCSNCTNCSSKSNPIGLINNSYINPNLNNLATQLSNYEHSDSISIDKQQGALNSQASSSLASASIYLQHQNQHRHPII